MTTSEAKVTIEISTNNLTREKKIQGEMENGGETDGNTLKMDLTGANTMTGRGEGPENWMATVTVKGETTTGIEIGTIRRAAIVVTARTAGIVQDNHVVLPHPSVAPAPLPALKVLLTRPNQISDHLDCLRRPQIP